MIIRGDLFKEYDALVDMKRFVENALNFYLARKSRNRSCSILMLRILDVKRGRIAWINYKVENIP